jgi:oxygen-independent coproporphyrinogen III oxidase
LRPGIYIHIPFCEQRCYYCAFTVLVAREDTYGPYVDRLIREIELSGWTEPPETIFFGGGTPSILDAQMIKRILAALPAGATEISLETNPGTLNADKVQAYREIGINRISLGVQSFHDEDLKAAGRLHKAADVFHDIELLRAHGCSNINVDLIAGLPDQRLSVWKSNLDWVARLRPEHVSIYMLELEERSPWSRNTPQIQADEEFVLFYQTACDELEASGYRHYEISNWALPGRECRHNLKYWTAEPYRGFGVGAHSFDGGTRFWNTASLPDYAAAIDSGKLPIDAREVLTPNMRIEEGFMLGLRRIDGFNIRTLAEDLGIRYPAEWFARVEELQRAELIQFDGTTLKLTPAGWLVASGVTEELLWPTLLSTSEATP